MKRTLFPTLRLNAEWKDGCAEPSPASARPPALNGIAEKQRRSSLFALTLHASKYIT